MNSIALSLGVVRSTVERVIQRFAASSLTWPPAPALTDVELERRLYHRPAHIGSAKVCVRPHYAEAIKQLARKGVTRRLLWSEYRDSTPMASATACFVTSWRPTGPIATCPIATTMCPARRVTSTSPG